MAFTGTAALSYQSRETNVSSELAGIHLSFYVSFHRSACQHQGGSAKCLTVDRLSLTATAGHGHPHDVNGGDHGLLPEGDS